MSFFYLSPVKGDIHVHLLEIIVTHRLEYLKAIFKGDSSVYNEYVVEGSIYDNVGHFMLCVVTILGDNTGVTQFFIKAEMELFKRRIESLSAYDMRSFAKKLLRSIKKQDKITFFIEPLLTLCQHLMLKDVAEHICSLSHSNHCVLYNITLHFKHCLAFIAKRQVELKDGMAFMPCGKWKQYLLQLFSSNLSCRIKRTNLETLKRDSRITELSVKLKREMYPSVSNKSNLKTLLCKDVNVVSKYFPPCMLNLHQNLRSKHRLSHSQRFYYSLFLKDIGMPVEEAVEFWRMEYRQSPNGSHSCSHSWERDEKKYLYGIRHMYGLEGCHTNYTSVSCQRIQSSDTSCSEGGCPFKSFDEPKMLSLLNSGKCTEPVLSQINELRERGQFMSACAFYLQKSLEFVPCDNISFNFTPVKYFMIASNNQTMDL